jgi:uncharacterized protein (DUF1330 family)
MPAYCIANVEVLDPVAYENYRSRTLATITPYGGRFIVRGGTAESKEGAWRAHRIVMVEFPDLDTANRWYHSPEYQAIIPFRDKAARTDLMIVEGVAP